jgi:lysophospholipase L1-like esterase
MWGQSDCHLLHIYEYSILFFPVQPGKLTISNIKNFLAPAIVGIAILIILEIVAGLILSHIYNRKFDSALIEENKYGPSSGLKANAYGIVWDKPFHTDEMGGRKHRRAKAGKPKMLIIGDSVTEGVGVGDSSVFANIINDRLDSFDVRNISLIGWSVGDYDNAINKLVEKDTAIRTIALCYCLNDIYGQTALKNMPSIARKGFIGRINGFLQDRYATYKLIKLLIYQNSDRYYQYDRSLYTDQDKVQAAALVLAHIRDICSAHKIAFTIFILPYRSQLQNRDELPQTALIAECRKNQINYSDLLHALVNDGKPKELYLFADEIHLSALGHRRLAAAISAYYQ